MKTRLLVLGLSLGLITSFIPFAFAEEMQEMGGNMQQGPGQKGKHMMMGMMQKSSVVATSDGGVIILEGHRLLKYDSSLTLVKEVELPKGKGPGPREGGNEPSQPTEEMPE